jgi:hypothetical protein
MPLVNILYPPSGADGFAEWLFSHQQDHNEISGGALKILGANLPQYILDPMQQSDIKSWLLRHQQAHTDMNSLLGLAGQDLQDVDFEQSDQIRAWMYQNFTEHQAARTRLGI